MAKCFIGNANNGGLEFPKLLNFDSSEPERPGERFRSLTGNTVHQIAATDESDREFQFDIICSKSNRDILLSIYRSTSSLVSSFQDGENAFSGYLKSCNFVSNPRSNYFIYRARFYVTEKLTA